MTPVRRTPTAATGPGPRSRPRRPRSPGTRPPLTLVIKPSYWADTLTRLSKRGSQKRSEFI